MSNPYPFNSRYLEFERNLEAEQGKKTQVWLVISKSSGEKLAEIRWFGRWRQYTFFPEPATVWNHECLSDIDHVIINLMAERDRSRHELLVST